MAITFSNTDNLQRSLKSIFLIGLIILSRKKLNEKSIKWANIILWSILFIYLIFPHGILIEVDDLEKLGPMKKIFELSILTKSYLRAFEITFGNVLSDLNLTIIASLLVIFMLRKIYLRNKSLKETSLIDYDIRINDQIKSFNLKRKIEVLANDQVKVPMTFGIIKPKILIPNQILDDDDLLKYVMVHELTHIKKFDIVFTYIKNIIIFIFWHNIFLLLVAKYIEEDIEILCDKLVIQRLGDNMKNRQNYCYQMLKLLKLRDSENSFSLKFSPTKERILVMKNYKKTLSGIFLFVLISLFSLTSFADCGKSRDKSTIYIERPEETIVNVDNRVKEIDEDEYEKMELGETSENQLKAINNDRYEKLNGLDHKTYTFNMKSYSGVSHDGFSVKLSNLECKDEVSYQIIIKEADKVIYRRFSTKALILKFNAYSNKTYEIIINNLSTYQLKYNIKINSYKK